jgi:hypothetical protein
MCSSIQCHHDTPSALVGLDQEFGTPVATRTTPPPKVDAAQEAAFIKKVIELAPKFRTELLKEAK